MRIVLRERTEQKNEKETETSITAYTLANTVTPSGIACASASVSIYVNISLWSTFSSRKLALVFVVAATAVVSYFIWCRSVCCLSLAWSFDAMRNYSTLLLTTAIDRLWSMLSLIGVWKTKPSIDFDGKIGHWKACSRMHLITKKTVGNKIRNNPWKIIERKECFLGLSTDSSIDRMQHK